MSDTDTDDDGEQLPDNVVVYLRATTCASPHDDDEQHGDECGRVELHIDDDLPPAVVFGVFNTAIAHYVKRIAAKHGRDPEQVVQELSQPSQPRTPDVYDAVPGNPFGAIDPMRGFKP